MNASKTLNDQCLTLTVPGDLISTTLEPLRGHIQDLSKGSPATAPAWTTLRLDLTGAAMVDSAGLNLVVTLLKQAQSRGARLQIAYSNPNVLRSLKIHAPGPAH